MELSLACLGLAPARGAIKTFVLRSVLSTLKASACATSKSARSLRRSVQISTSLSQPMLVEREHPAEPSRRPTLRKSRFQLRGGPPRNGMDLKALPRSQRQPSSSTSETRRPHARTGRDATGVYGVTAVRPTPCASNRDPSLRRAVGRKKYHFTPR